MHRGRGTNGYRNRGNSSSRARGRGYGSRQRGLFADGSWRCDCEPRLPAEKFRVKKEGKNQGRWFYTCQQSDNGCGFFLWEDDAKPREEAAVLSGKRTEPTREGLQEGWNAGRPREDQQQVIGKGLFAGSKGTTMDHDDSTASPTPSPPIKSEPRDGNSSKRTANAAELDEDEYGLSSVSERDLANMADSMPPTTPHKAQKTGVYATPGTTAVKRKLPWEEAPTTPAARTHATDSFFDTPSKQPPPNPSAATEPRTPAIPSAPASALSPSPPTRFKDALQNPDDTGSSLTREVLDVLSATKVPPDIYENVRSICAKHDLRYQGVVKGRNISRLATNAKDAKIAELHARIASLEADFEVERSLNRMKKWESTGAPE